MVYVDNQGVQGIVNDRTSYWCRLTADTSAELHDKARELGIDYRFFCPATNGAYHVKSIDLAIGRDTYLVTMAMAARAVALFGVRPVRKEVSFTY